MDTAPLGGRKETRPPYPPQLRARLIELARSGRTPEELGRQFEPSGQTIRNWLRQADRDEGRREDGLTAEIIGREGGVVVGVDTDKARLEEVVNGIREGGGRAEAKVADALDGAKVAAAVDAVVRAHGRIDILVNAVGGSTIIERPAATADELTLEEWHRVITFNLDGTFLFCHAVVPVMKRQRSGKIVNISSIAGRGVAANSGSAYAAAKGGIIAFTRKLSLELGPFGITVNAIAPSTTLTERLRARRTPDQIAAEAARTPLGRMAVAEDQARVICFLASRDADFVTGVTIDVTGGQSG